MKLVRNNCSRTKAGETSAIRHARGAHYVAQPSRLPHPYRTRPACFFTAGFTLLEILIATLAFAIVLAAINTVFYTALRLRNRTTEAIETSLPQQQALTIIKRDLANLVVPGGTFSGELQTASTTNNMTGQGNPTFCTSTGVIDETSPWSEVQKVSYVLMESTNHSRAKELVRAVTRNLLPSTTQEPPIYQWLMSGVEAVNFAFYDGTQWRDYWDSSTATTTDEKVPQAIKMQIALA